MTPFSKEEKIVHTSFALILLFSIITILYNLLFLHYYVPFSIIKPACIAIIIAYSVYALARTITPKPALLLPIQLLTTIALLVVTLALAYTANLAVLSTPFSMHDHFLHQMDRTIGFHLLPILQFVHDHPAIKPAIWAIYYSPLILCQAVPIMLILIDGAQATVFIYYAAINFSLTMGHLIFYFFPSMTSPAAVYPSQYFTHFELQTFHAFALEHAHKVTDFQFLGGVISFPSYHAIWILLVCYFLRPKLGNWVILYGVIAIYAVIFSGWHYFFDLVGGVIIGFLSIKISEHYSQHAP